MPSPWSQHWILGSHKLCNGVAVPFECQKGHVLRDTVIRHMGNDLTNIPGNRPKVRSQ